MRGSSIALVLIAACGLSGCVPVSVHRAALTPHTEPVLYSAEPSEGIAEIGLGASSVAHAMHIEEGNPDSAVEVPGTQVRGDARFQVNDFFAVGFAYENGLDATAQQGKASQPPVDNGNVQGYGFLGDISIHTRNPNLFVGLHFDMMVWRVPWVEWQTCTGSPLCGDNPFTIQTKGHDSVGTFAFALTPSYRSGPVVWFGGLTARQHPTIKEKGVEFDNLESDVESGPFNLVLSGGAEFDLGPQVKGSVVLYQNLTQDPVQYGPSLAAMVIVPLGKRHKTPAPAPTPVYGPPGL